MALTAKQQQVIDRVNDPRTYALLSPPIERVQMNPHPDCTADQRVPEAETICPGCDTPLGYLIPIKYRTGHPTMHVECLAYAERDALEVAA